MFNVRPYSVKYILDNSFFFHRICKICLRVTQVPFTHGSPSADSYRQLFPIPNCERAAEKLPEPNVRCWSQQRGDRGGCGRAVWAALRQIMCVAAAPPLPSFPPPLIRLPHHRRSSGQYETSGGAGRWGWGDGALTGPCNRTIDKRAGEDTHTPAHARPHTHTYARTLAHSKVDMNMLSVAIRECFSSVTI